MSTSLQTINQSPSGCNNSRVADLNRALDTGCDAVAEELDSLLSQIVSVTEILENQLISNPTDVGNSLALARLLELRLEVSKKRLDVLKIRLGDKTAELGTLKKQTAAASVSLEDILNGAAVGAAVGASAADAKTLASSQPACQSETHHFIPIVDAEEVVEAVIDEETNDESKSE